MNIAYRWKKLLLIDYVILGSEIQASGIHKPHHAFPVLEPMSTCCMTTKHLQGQNVITTYTQHDSCYCNKFSNVFNLASKAKFNKKKIPKLSDEGTRERVCYSTNLREG